MKTRTVRLCFSLVFMATIGCSTDDSNPGQDFGKAPTAAKPETKELGKRKVMMGPTNVVP